MEKPIGVFDSGLGGLTVINALMAAMPGESFVYVGDTARTPYGEKDVDTLRSYGRQIVSFLLEQDVKVVVAACGTISSTVVEDLRREFNVPIIDVVRPGIDAALGQAKKRLGVIATAATIKSGFFQRTIKEKNPQLEVEAKACPLFVPLIEEGLEGHDLAVPIVRAYLKDWQDEPVLDTLILGCTHYPLLAPALRQVLPDTTLIDMAVATVGETRKYLEKNNLLNCNLSNELKDVSRKFYVSGDVEKFNDMGGRITGLHICAEKVRY